MKTKLQTRVLMTIMVVACVLALILGIGIGGVYIPPKNIIGILAYKIFNHPLPQDMSGTTVSILWTVRLPRALLAFLAGGALSVSGTVMQSVLKNPLASSYTLGVSSGASLGAGIVIVTGFTLPVIGILTLPLMGLTFGLVTVFAAIAFASGFDKNMGNHTIILTGIIFSLFINAIMTLISALNRDQIQKLLFWQMGSFSSKGWTHVYILAPICIVLIAIILRYTNELDIMTFGEEQAQMIGVDIKRIKWTLLFLTSALTGGAVAMAGVIGFIDLIAPHIVRKIFGSRHRYTVPMSALFGGAFMVICDLLARTVTSPLELPVGAVTAIIGAPFFAYVYFMKKK